MANWAATQAKAHFSAVLDKAETEGPQLVQRRKKRFVLLTEEELTRRTAASQHAPDGRTSGQSLWEALRLAPEARFDVDFPQLAWEPRAVDL